MAVCLWIYGLGSLVSLAAVSLMTLPYALLMGLLPESETPPHGPGARSGRLR